MKYTLEKMNSVFVGTKQSGFNNFLKQQNRMMIMDFKKLFSLLTLGNFKFVYVYFEFSNVHLSVQKQNQ